MISHPSSPFQGQRYSEPVELIDIFPTVLDMFPAVNPGISTSPPAAEGKGKDRDKPPCHQLHRDMDRCQPLQGKSLAPVVLGTPLGDQTASSALYNKHVEEGEALRGQTKKQKKVKGKKPKSKGLLFPPPSPPLISAVMPSLGADLFAVSQSWQCANKQQLARTEQTSAVEMSRDYDSPFFECNRDENLVAEKREQQVSVMGYTFRWASFRYTCWRHWDRVRNVPDLSLAPYAEELYDHRHETLQNFTHLELANLVQRPEFREVAARLRSRALLFLQKEVKFRGPYK